VNVSIKNVSKRTEIKNVNSITEIVRAIKSEIERHRKEKPQKQETRRWNSQTGKTEFMRSKENAEDYRFIPDPDLPAIKITKKIVEKIKSELPESPMEKLEKTIKKYKINKTDAEVLIKNLEIVELFEKVIEKIQPPIALPWITVEWLGVLNYNKKTMDDVEINPQHIIELLQLIQENKITQLKAKEILRKFIPKSYSPIEEAKSSEKISDETELKKIIQKILKENKKSVDDYKNGESKAMNFLMGKIMQETNRRADFEIAKKVLENELKN
jgi:aspartyl-tRNA(Asn)/glutamyl-tRNA(Gln) amidotransferase subunit B